MIFLKVFLLNPYFMSVLIVNVIGLLYIRRVNKGYEVKNKKVNEDKQ